MLVYEDQRQSSIATCRTGGGDGTFVQGWQLACARARELVRPLLEYAAEVASLTPWPDAEQLQVTMGKRILQCWTHTTNEAVLGELGWQLLEARAQQLRVSFWAKLLAMPPDSPARLVYDASLVAYSASVSGDHSLPTGAALTAADGWQVYYHPPSEPGVTPWPAQIKADLHTLGLQHE